VRGRPRRVAVLGSARLTEADPSWVAALEVGRLLANAGFEVLTGGYGGLMAAVAQGAREAGGRVIGLPMKHWTHLTPNPWNAQLRWVSGYPERLAAVLEANALIALDGGVGTLSELAVAWAAAQTEEDMPALVVVGERWRRVLGVIRGELVVDSDDLALVHVVDTPAEAVAVVLECFASPPTGPRRPRG
jgi:uncharacterized protein (TIGR00730 family)